MTHKWNSRGRATCIVVGCLSLGAFAAACSSDDATTTATTTAPASVCADAQALSTSVDSLKAVDVKAEGTNGVNAAIASVKDDLTALESSASAAVKPDVQAIQTAVDELETAAANISTEGVAPTATAVASVATSTRTLVDKIESGSC